MPSGAQLPLGNTSASRKHAFMSATIEKFEVIFNESTIRTFCLVSGINIKDFVLRVWEERKVRLLWRFASLILRMPLGI